ncbi:MAG: pyridoxamine 5'-phosphate oxidase [Arenicellales bacterium]|jgi:pyridoxamine 5'-phosphate oxidase|nr:pyridoxamine 5'-phosphate oxidase [Arenicellales bacterium]
MTLPEHIREDFSRGPLDPDSLANDPIEQFERWFSEACAADPDAPNAVSLATASSLGQPSVRTVLMKIYDARGFVFFTNYTSRKARDLDENPRAAMLFPWVRQGRQVIVRGPISRIAAGESLKYFLTRSRGSQLGAWASNQSSVISARAILESKLLEVKQKFSSGAVPLPSFWGGYRLEPESIEFWQSQSSRLHDRFEYTRDAGGEWVIARLAP